MTMNSYTDVLGLTDTSNGDQNIVYTEFKEQLQRNTQSWHQTGFPWKPNHPTLHNNKNGSLARLSNLLSKLQRDPELFKKHDDKTKEQLAHKIVEEAPATTTSKEFYTQHKPVVKQSAATTKLRIAYDVSAKPTKASPLLNECLEVGPALQNTLWNVLTRCRLKSVALTGDLKQAFLQIRINKDDRDSLIFHWIKDRKTLETVVFTRLMFRLSPSPFVLEGTIKYHLEQYKKDQPETVMEVK